MKQLLANNRLDPNSKDTEYGPTLLLRAAGKGTRRL
jgi:hypothetical protein